MNSVIFNHDNVIVLFVFTKSCFFMEYCHPILFCELLTHSVHS